MSEFDFTPKRGQLPQVATGSSASSAWQTAGSADPHALRLVISMLVFSGVACGIFSLVSIGVFFALIGGSYRGEDAWFFLLVSPALAVFSFVAAILSFALAEVIRLFIRGVLAIEQVAEVARGRR